MNKSDQRARALSARRAMTENERAAASAQICRTLLQLPVMQTARTVFSYLAMPEEADLSDLHARLLERGCRVAFPVTQPGGIMAAYVPDLPWQLVRDRFGIRSPLPAAAVLVKPREIDVVLAPCVAFDDRCRRLGHGGGYYDRYLPLCRGAALLGVAFELQRVPAVACDPLDVPMDAFVTERAIYGP